MSEYYTDYKFRRTGFATLHTEMDPNGITLYFKDAKDVRFLINFVNTEIENHGYLTIDRLAEELECFLTQPVKRTYRNAVLGDTEMFKEKDVISTHKIRNSWEYEYVLTLPKGKPLLDMNIHFIDSIPDVK